MKRQENLLQKVLRLSVMLFVLLISLYPILWVFISSFKSRMDIMNSPLKLPSQLFLNGYKEVFTTTPVLTYFKNSLIVATTSTLLSVMIVALAAYIVARFEFKFKNAIVAMFASTLFIPTIAISYPIFRMIKSLGLYDTKAGLILTYMSFNIAVSFFVIRSYILNIPKELDEAALIDGAGYGTIFFRIILPIAKPGIVSAAIIAFLGNWNDFYYALLLTGGDQSRTMPVMVYNFTSTFRGNLCAMFASMVISMLPTILLFSLTSEQIVKSMSDGAVKG